MDSYGEDAEINDDRHPLRSNEEHDDEFSMSSYDGEQTDSLIIKPPQAVALHRDKKEKREKRDRHRHKGERHKDRHRNRERGSGHEERRREHRRHRERDPERREGKRHEKHRERSNVKHERLVGDLRNKLEKDRKLNERELMRARERAREREEYYMDDHIYDPRAREHLRASGLMHHRERRQDDHANFGPPSLMGLDLSPREKTEREKRMERFMLAEKQKEITQRDADARRQRREEERREEKRMEELRQRAEESMLRNVGKNLSSSERSKKKKRKHTLLKEAEPETVELISDDDEEEEKESEEEMEEDEETNYETKKKRRHDQVVNEEEEEKEPENRTPRSASSGPTSVALNSPTTTSPQKSLSHSDSSSSTSSEEDEDDEDDDDDDDENDDDDDAEENKDIAKNGAIPIPAKKTSRSDTRSGSGTSSDDDSTDQEKKDDSDNDSTTSKKGNYLDFSPAASPHPHEVKELLPSYYPAIMGCRSVDEFECLNRIEEGTYGVVYRAREKSTNQIVALKRLKMEKEKEGFPITSLREVNTLLKGQHENIVTVREIVVGSNMDKIYIVMDYVEHDLKSLMETMRKKKQAFTIGEVKTLMIQLLRAVHHLHDNWILHRDLKTSNLLLSHRGILKVGDFGLAREYGSPLKQYTPIVVTLWYRAPELLLGTKEYSCPIDVWSVGCIFGELLGMESMFPGKSEIDQLNKIFKDLGTPSDKIWPGYSQMPVIKKTQFAYYPYNHLKERFKTRLSTEGFKLLNSFLTYNPAKRITCSEAMTHDYFYKEEPAPIDPAMFPTWPAKSELPHGGRKKGVSPKPPSGGKDFKALGDGEDESIAGFFLGGAPLDGPGFTLKF